MQDIRLYAAVTSARPLRAFVYTEGLARFGTQKYDLKDLDNVYCVFSVATLRPCFLLPRFGDLCGALLCAAHLTNFSINKTSPNYTDDKDTIGGGAKWLLSRLFKYLQDNGKDTQLLWHRIRHVVILTLLILTPHVPEEADGCFELYGALPRE